MFQNVSAKKLLLCIFFFENYVKHNYTSMLTTTKKSPSNISIGYLFIINTCPKLTKKSI